MTRNVSTNQKDLQYTFTFCSDHIWLIQTGFLLYQVYCKDFYIILYDLVLPTKNSVRKKSFDRNQSHLKSELLFFMCFHSILVAKKQHFSMGLISSDMNSHFDHEGKFFFEFELITNLGHLKA